MTQPPLRTPTEQLIYGDVMEHRGVRDVKRLGLMALLFGVVSFAPLVPADAAPTAGAPSGQVSDQMPTGLWMTPDHDAVIQIAPCGTDLCGQIVGMVLQPTDPTPRDWAGTSQCGLTIIRAEPQRDNDGRMLWRGTIVNPRDGQAYHAQFRVGADHQLLLRGYVALPIFGRTEHWDAYTGPNTPVDCRLSETPS